MPDLLHPQARTILESLADAVVVVNPEGRIVFANPSAESLFQAPRESLLGQPVERLVPEPVRDVHREHRTRYRAAPAARRMGNRPVMQARRWDGTTVSVDVSLCPLPGGHVLAAVRDETWRERLLQELRESEERFRLLVERASEVLYQVAVRDDPLSGQVTFVSPQCERITGYGADAFIQDPRRWLSLIHSDDLPAVAETTMASLTARREATRYYRIRNARGEYRHVADRIVPLVDAQGALAGYQGAARDITDQVRAREERERLEERLRQAERMETLGRLAGGIAHDFNNILTVVLGYCESLLDDLPPPSPAHRDVGEIVSAARRAAGLTQQLLAFSRRQVITPRLLDLNAHVAGLEQLLRQTATERIELVYRLGPELWPVRMDPSQMDQILLNLISNARDAISREGRITVTTGHTRVEAGFCGTRPGLTPGDYVVLSVSDNGGGMDETTVRNAFVPFFTTKASGRGTGIGLASVYGIVKQNGGYIEIDSEPGRGTSVAIYLPRAHEEPEIPATSATIGPGTQGAATILLVEDDDALRGITRRLLARLGYTVLEAATPSAALAIGTDSAQDIHLLLTDVVMPEMNGAELAERLRAIRPGIATLFMSGYASVLASDLVAPERRAFFLAKPFDQTALQTAVRTALGSVVT